MNPLYPHPVLNIHASALRSNVERLQRHLSSTKQIIAVIKANAYGTQVSQVARTLQQAGVQAFAVANLREARELRQAGVLGPLLVFHLLPGEYPEAIRLGCDVCLSDPLFLEPLSQAALCSGQKVNIHLHVNTGMGRLACRLEEALPLAQRVNKDPGLNLVGLMSHLASAEDPNQDSFTHQQVALFSALVTELATLGIRPPWIHLANSAGAIRFPELPFNTVRVGLALYGIAPSQTVRRSLSLEPVLSLKAPVIDLRKWDPGTPVGYGSLYHLGEAGGRIATLALGYHEGLPRAYWNKGQVYLQNRQVPLAGMISMDYTTLNVSSLPSLKLGDEAEIFGPHIPMEEVAARAGVIPHELLARLGGRLERQVT